MRLINDPVPHSIMKAQGQRPLSWIGDHAHEEKMKIRDFLMEDWLISNRRKVKYNLGESGVADYYLHELLRMCNLDAGDLLKIRLEDELTYGSDFLRGEIARTYRNIDPGSVLVTTGTSEGIFILFNLLLKRGDEVVTGLPGFQSLYEVPRALGCRVKYIRLCGENEYLFDADDLKRLITGKTKLIIINNPHNPSGALLPEDTIKNIISIAKENNINIIFDEHYRFLPIDDGLRIRSACEIDDYAICTGSIVKCFGLMGLRVGWLVTNKPLLERCRSFKDYTTHTLSPLSDFLAAHALKARDTILSKNLRFIRKNHVLLTDFVARHSDTLSFIAPKAGVVSFIKYNHAMPSDEFAGRLIKKEGVFVLPGSSFEVGSHFRLGYGIKSEDFKPALDRLSRFLTEIK